MTDAPTPLDLDAIEAAIAACRTHNFGMYQADRLALEHAPALVEEVKRLRAALAEVERLTAEVQERDEWLHETAALLPEGFDGDEWEGEVIARFIRQAARPAPAWDEEAVQAEVLGIDARHHFHGTACLCGFDSHGRARSATEHITSAVLAVVRDNQPVKPRRETVRDEIAGHPIGSGYYATTVGVDEAAEIADAVLSLLPGRSEAEVKAESKAEAWDEGAIFGIRNQHGTVDVYIRDAIERHNPYRLAAREVPTVGDVDRTLAVKPDRGDVYRAWHGTDDPWAGCADSASIERVLDLWPGRTESEVKAEALRDAADEWHAEHYGTRPAAYKFLWDRADRLAAEGGADRG